MKYLSIIAVLFLFACNQTAEQAASFESIESEALMKSKFDAENPSSADEAIELKRKLIKRGNVRFEVKDLNEKEKVVKQLTQQFKGYLSNEETQTFGDRIEYSFTVRLPAHRFNDFLEELSSGVTYFDKKNITVDDVTEQFLDIEARLKTKKALEERYANLLSKARNVSEILEIERELNKVRADVESMEGRLKYLSDQVAFSTLEIAFYKRIGKDARFGNKFTDSIKTGWNILVSLVLGVVTLWPIVLILVLGVWLFRRFWRKK